MKPQKEPKKRTLNKAKVIDAAFGVLDERGMSGLTLKVLAERLDVQAPALYKHFDGKDALYIAMTHSMFNIWAGTVKQQEYTSWQDLLIRYAVECRTMLLNHREGARLFATYHQYVQSDFSIYMLTSLRRQGFLAKDAIYALSTLLSFVIGFALEEDFDKHIASVAIERLDKQNIAPELLDHTQSPDQEFQYGIDCIMCGTKALLEVRA